MALEPTQTAVITVNLGPTHKDRPVEQMSAPVVNGILYYIISEPYIFFMIKNISLLSTNKIYKYFSISVCPAGSFLNADNGGACEVCPVNKYSTTTNSASCMDCPAGTNTQQQTGQVNADACGK